jgi:hypothetical protein
MSSGDKDVRAGPFQPMSIEEEARKANIKFWRLGDDLSGSDEEAKEAVADEVGEEAKEGAADEVDSESEYDFEAEDGNDAGSSNGDKEDDTSSHGGGDHMDVGGLDATAKKKKKERQDQTPPVLGTKLKVFMYVKLSGQPVEPAKLAAGYGLQLGCIVRESMGINQKNLRAKGNTRLRELLIEKLHNWYKFPELFDSKKLKGNKANKLALMRMSTALSSWKSQVKKRILTGKSWEEIKKAKPMLDEDEFIKFKDACLTPKGIEWTEWGRHMWDLNIGNQRYGGGGYQGNKAVWAKEDAEYARLGKENPWHKFTDEQAM